MGEAGREGGRVIKGGRWDGPMSSSPVSFNSFLFLLVRVFFCLASVLAFFAAAFAGSTFLSFPILQNIARPLLRCCDKSTCLARAAMLLLVPTIPRLHDCYRPSAGLFYSPCSVFSEQSCDSDQGCCVCAPWKISSLNCGGSLVDNSPSSPHLSPPTKTRSIRVSRQKKFESMERSIASVESSSPIPPIPPIGTSAGCSMVIFILV